MTTIESTGSANGPVRQSRTISELGSYTLVRRIFTPSTNTREVAFQANSGQLWTVGSDNHGSWGLGMKVGTSPSIAALPGGGYEVAFQANSGQLWTVGSDNHGSWGLGMKVGTSPEHRRALPGGG